MMNSLYGATANKHFLYYIAEMAEAITMSGQLAIRYAEKHINAYMNKIMKTENVDYIIYMDTDSAFVDFASLILKTFDTLDIDNETGENFLDEVCKSRLESVISSGYDLMAEDTNAYRNAMTMKREKICNKMVMVAKKRYIVSVLNNEGVHYEQPKISVTGVESVRSSTPEVCRNKLKESFSVILEKDEDAIQKFIIQFKEEFKTLPVEQIAKISGTDDLEKYSDKNTIFKSGCPIHVRGSLLYNKALIDRGLETKYEKITNGDKVKFVYLKTPNTIGQNVIAFVNILPKEFGLEKYIDHELQFHKVFLKPLENILSAVGWESTKVDNLSSFFE